MPAERTLSNGFGSFQVEASAGIRGRPTCEACRQRKVRCNRKVPCSNCSRFQLSCVYAERSRRGPIKPPARVSPSPSHETPATNGSASEPSNTDILRRLENVEALLKTLVAQGLPSNQPNESQTAPRPASTSQGASTHELLLGNGERGDYVDDSMFVHVLLDVGFHTCRLPQGPGLNLAGLCPSVYCKITARVVKPASPLPAPAAWNHHH